MLSSLRLRSREVDSALGERVIYSNQFKPPGHIQSHPEASFTKIGDISQSNEVEGSGLILTDEILKSTSLITIILAISVIKQEK